jgi:hypothetical protein
MDGLSSVSTTGVRSDIGLHREDNEDAAYAGAQRTAQPASAGRQE